MVFCAFLFLFEFLRVVFLDNFIYFFLIFVIQPKLHWFNLHVLFSWIAVLSACQHQSLPNQASTSIYIFWEDIPMYLSNTQIRVSISKFFPIAYNLLLELFLELPFLWRCLLYFSMYLLLIWISSLAKISQKMVLGCLFELTTENRLILLEKMIYHAISLGWYCSHIIIISAFIRKFNIS